MATPLANSCLGIFVQQGSVLVVSLAIFFFAPRWMGVVSINSPRSFPLDLSSGLPVSTSNPRKRFCNGIGWVKIRGGDAVLHLPVETVLQGGFRREGNSCQQPGDFTLAVGLVHFPPARLFPYLFGALYTGS